MLVNSMFNIIMRERKIKYNCQNRRIVRNRTILIKCMGVIMDRRQRKTRDAIFRAFTALLSKKDISRITVSDIIDEADVGRATFYAHFETKEYLIRDMCGQLFSHIIDGAIGISNSLCFCDSQKYTESVFLHLFCHLCKNDANLLVLLRSESNDVFLSYFKTDLKKLIKLRFADEGLLNTAILPENYLIDHISASLVETISWWIENGERESPEELAALFESAVGHLIIKKRPTLDCQNESAKNI